MTNNEKEYMISKLIQYGIFLVCIAGLLSIIQINSEGVKLDQDFSVIVEQAYDAGAERTEGGGVIGTIIAVPLIEMFGNTGAIIVTIGVALVLVVFMFGIRPAEMISEMLYNWEERREEKKEQRKEGKKENSIKAQEESAAKEEKPREERKVLLRTEEKRKKNRDVSIMKN